MKKSINSIVGEFPFATILDFEVFIILGFAVLEVVKADVGIFADLDTPPSPHEVAKHDSQLKLRQNFFYLHLHLGPLLHIPKRLFILIITPVLSHTITLHKQSLQFLIILRQLIPHKLAILIFHIKIHFKLVEIVSNVINGIVVGGVLVVDEDVLVVRVLYEDVVG